MRRWWPAVLVAVWLQLAWLPFVRPWGVVPNVVMIVVVLAALELPVSAGLGLAIVAGLLLDLAGGGWFGWSMLVLVTLVLAVGFVNTQVGWELDGWWVPVILAAAATIIMALGIFLAVLVEGGTIEWPIVMTHIVIELAVNVGLVLGGRVIIGSRWLARGGL